MTRYEERRFNPCFNGTYSLTKIFTFTKILRIQSFNPCFNGTYSLTMVLNFESNIIIIVLILVLMELTL